MLKLSPAGYLPTLQLVRKPEPVKPMVDRHAEFERKCWDHILPSEPVATPVADDGDWIPHDKSACLPVARDVMIAAVKDGNREYDWDGVPAKADGLYWVGVTAYKLAPTSESLTRQCLAESVARRDGEWVEWAGGDECPFKEYEHGTIRYQDGTEEGAYASTLSHCPTLWNKACHKAPFFYITAYRLAK